MRESAAEKNLCSRRRLALVTALIIALGAYINSVMFAADEPQALSIAASHTSGQSLRPRSPLEFRLNRPLISSEGRLAMFVGYIDVSSLLTISDTSIIYNPSIVPLPVGETQTIIYLISSDGVWKEAARFPLRVEAPASPTIQEPSDLQSKQHSNTSPSIPSAQPARRKSALDRGDFSPSLTIGMKSQTAASFFPDSNRPTRATFADFSLQGSVRADMTLGLFNSQISFDVLGSSFRQEALRFGELQNAAPRIDLSSYLMQFQTGKVKFSVGHVSFGTNRHLINSFSSRGISVTLPVTSRGDFSLAAMNGTSIVGWSNFFGLSRSDHQIITGTFGFEFIKERPGGVRFETSIVDGRLLPLNNFNQSAITDTERSRGMGFRVIASDQSQRMRLDGGYARSRFTNPADPLLFQGRDVVPVNETTRDARYLDASYALLQDLALGESRKANITINYRHENIAPLFRSVTAFVQPDRAQNQIEVVAAIGDVTATLSHQRFNDNLENIPTILKTLNRRNNLIVGTPLGSLFGNRAQPSRWLPRISYSMDEFHQFAPTVPVGGGFEGNASTIPDQVSRNQNARADWQLEKWRFGYRFNRSFQDNRQPGRERADLINFMNGFSLGFNPTSRMDLNLEASFENAINRETNGRDHTLTLGPVINWRVTESMALAIMLSGTSAGDVAGINRSRNANLDLQWSYRFSLERSRYRRVHGNFFVRYASRYASNFDSVFGLNSLTRLNTLNTGLSFTFF
jgi:hypothetical protein